MTIRPDHVLHEIPVNEWTEEEAFEHLRKTFDIACRDFPDVMERYVVALVELTRRDEMKEMMRQGLRETISQRNYFKLIPTQNEAAE